MANITLKSASRKEYERCVMVLNTMKDNAHFGPLSSQFGRRDKIELLLNCIKRLDMNLDDIDNLNIIHVTGTKGKGSTCSYTESILRQHGYKTGLFGSPHLVETRERIAINGRPVDEEMFTDAFWHVYYNLTATKAGNHDIMPAHFSMTLLMALYIFLAEKVDVVILEVGIGGEYDATNFVRHPIACGVTSLHVEHADELGNTVGEIAWHKSGIAKVSDHQASAALSSVSYLPNDTSSTARKGELRRAGKRRPPPKVEELAVNLGSTVGEVAWHSCGVAKKGIPLFTVQQPVSAMEVILARAQKRECPVYLAQRLKEEEIGLGIAGDRQTINAGLALQLCRTFLQFKLAGPDVKNVVCNVTTANVSDIPLKVSGQLSREETQGLLTARLPGRAQIIKRPGITYYLDGAHTTESMQQCVAWFTEASKKEREQLSGNVQQCLVYRMKKDKNAANHLPFLTDIGFRRAGFCPYVVSTTARHQFPDNMDLTEDVADAQKLAETHLDCWMQLLLAKRLPPGPKQGQDELELNKLAVLLEGLENKMGVESHLNILDSAMPQCHLAEQMRALELLESSEKKGAEETSGDHKAPCESHCFTSIVAALWWAGLGKDNSLHDLAVADLQCDPKQQSTQDFLQYVQKINGFNPLTLSGREVVTDATDVDHVQVLVTGSVALVGGVLSLIQPDLWG